MVPRLTFRAARSALAAAVCVGMALLGHVAAGGAVPGTGVVTAAGVAVAGACFVHTGRRHAWEVVAPVLLAAQAGLHLLFHSAAADRHVASPPSGTAGSDAVLEYGMLAAHVWAAAVTAWWLAGGEAALWSALRWGWNALPRVPRRVTVPACPAPLRSRRAHAALASARLEVLRHVVAERAPPVVQSAR